MYFYMNKSWKKASAPGVLEQDELLASLHGTISPPLLSNAHMYSVFESEKMVA